MIGGMEWQESLEIGGLDMIVLIFLFAYLSNVLAFDLFGDNVKKILGKKFLKPDADYYIQHHDETAFYLSSLWQQVLNKSDECSNEAERYLEYLRSPCISTLLFVTSLYRRTEKGMEDAVRDYAKDI
ncbi:hypothetical protein O9G_005623 [Rozella allomycis CSF55]|uniref:Uncharacterized protein n=1 Tax=Rozella allomycis (strain CSF55) TaxID=988480 RepID=A0A075AZF0_ROZAC|nr:hypothetical protein O9G_005623 [Rozella allomycis CSF55]|eukprot:EPZ33964.1 hypothetical protein O9G_005623 [Rozella allomycis CSF55]